MALYEIAVLGAPTKAQLGALGVSLGAVADSFRLRRGTDLRVYINPSRFDPDPQTASAAIFFGAPSVCDVDISTALDQSSIPVLPVASTAKRVSAEIPVALRSLNCALYKDHGPARVFSGLLECVGLLPRQRRVFLSYRRQDASAAAVQLFNELAARHFEVFLDTHSIGAGVDFQESLWHQLCDVDVLVMLDTPGYFSSRWTAAEFGRALAKGIGVLRVQWPDSSPSAETGTSSRVELLPHEISSAGQLASAAVDRLCSQLERFRTLAHATRHIGIVSAIEDAVRKVGGRIEGVGANRAIQICLRSGKRIVVQPTVGIPSARTLQDAIVAAAEREAAVVYDHIGLMASWREHLDWLERSVEGAKWIKVSEAAWDLAGWET